MLKIGVILEIITRNSVYYLLLKFLQIIFDPFDMDDDDGVIQNTPRNEHDEPKKMVLEEPSSKVTVLGDAWKWID